VKHLQSHGNNESALEGKETSLIARLQKRSASDTEKAFDKLLNASIGDGVEIVRLGESSWEAE